MKTRCHVSVGERFGRLVVTELTSVRRTRRQTSRRAAICICDCGAPVTVLVQALTREEGTRSCGCLKRRGTMSERFAETRQGPGVLHRRSHGLSRHPSYHRWFNMVDRYGNPSHPAYRNYGGRGITVHPEWRGSPAAFLAYLDSTLGPAPAGHSLDRVDNDGNYEPGNIRWASRSEQVRNRRRRS